MRFVPIVTTADPDRRVPCADCKALVVARCAFLDRAAPPSTYRCLTHALERGDALVVTIPVRLFDAAATRTLSRALYEVQGGDAATADLPSWSVADALFEIALAPPSTEPLGPFARAHALRFLPARATIGTLAEDTTSVPWDALEADRPVQLEVEVRVVDAAEFQTALADFGPSTAFGDPAEYLGRALRAFIGAHGPIVACGVEVHAYRAVEVPRAIA